MALLLTILFFIAAIAMTATIMFGMADAHVMPLACPSCYYGGDETLAGQHHPWYRCRPGGHMHCRKCFTRFREHPNGSLVEDRPIVDA